MCRRYLRKLVLGFALGSLAVCVTSVSQAQTKIACVGDSITEVTAPYPAKLQTLLGSGFSVQNAGANGNTLAKNIAYSSGGTRGASRSYFDSDNSKLQLALDQKPDIVIVMLGTNDSDTHSWDNAQLDNHAKDTYEADYKTLIGLFKAKNAAAKFFLASPPSATDTNGFGIRGSVIRGEIMPLVIKVAQATGSFYVDINKATESWVSADFKTPNTTLTYDGVHPTEAGGQMIADAMKAGLDSPMLIPGTGTGGAGGAGGAGAGGVAGGGGGGMAASGEGGSTISGAAGSGGMGNSGGPAGAGGSSGGSAGGLGGAGTPPGGMADAPASAPANDGGGCQIAWASKDAASGASLLLLAVLGLRSRRRTRA